MALVRQSSLGPPHPAGSAPQSAINNSIPSYHGPPGGPSPDYMDAPFPKMTPTMGPGGLPPNPQMMGMTRGMMVKGMEGLDPKYFDGPVGDGDESQEKVVESIYNLRNPEKREEALMELGRKRESFKLLAPLMWHSFGTIAILYRFILSYQVDWMVGCKSLWMHTHFCHHQIYRSSFPQESAASSGCSSAWPCMLRLEPIS